MSDGFFPPLAVNNEKPLECERDKRGWPWDLVFFVHVQFHVFEFVFVAARDSRSWRKSLFPIETCTLCHLLFNTQSENTNWLCFILPACPAFSRNGQDNIGSAATRDYSQSVIRDYCMALVLQTSACNLNLTRSHLAFICKITAQEMLSVISRSHSMWEIRPCCPLVTSLCWLVLEDFICCQQENKLYLGYLKK